MSEKIDNLEAEKMTLAAEFEAARESGDDKKISGLTSKLELLYWKFVEEILVERICSDRDELEFTEQDKLLINMGLLDESFVVGCKPGLRQRLLEEMAITGQINHFYLTEWLEDRFRRFKINESVAGERNNDDINSSKFETSRLRILERLAPFIKGLQGVTEDVAAAICTGRLDSQILNMGEGLLQNRLRRDLMTRHRLWDLRRQVLNRAKANANDKRNLKFFDVLDNLYRMEWREIYQDAQSSPNSTVEERRERKITEMLRAEKIAAQKKAKDFLIGELRFIKSLLPLGSLAGGILRAYAVMTVETPRVTKKDTAKILDNAAVCDRNFGASPVVLIAPFKGRGIYEWDRDSLVISLNPVSTPEDSAANSIANYTMMIDSLQKDGNIKNAYKLSFPSANYQKDFQSDYRQWMCEVGEGEIEAMPEEKLDFFRNNVGLDLSISPAVSLAPVEMRFLTSQARGIIRNQLRRQVASAKDSWAARWRLGLLSWMDDDLEEAVKEITHAAKLVPQQTPQLFGVGLLLLESGRVNQAEQILNICLKRGKNTIWRLYAADALKRLETTNT